MSFTRQTTSPRPHDPLGDSADGQFDEIEQIRLFDRARSLRRTSMPDELQHLLAGRKLGLLCESDQSADALAFRRAAVGLGAHVAHVRSNLTPWNVDEEVLKAARLLGRLYDAVECQGLPPALVKRLADASGIPVFDGVACEGHALARLAERMDGAGSLLERRQLMLQSFLLGSVA
jgi:ornithine carbamoyltransferase